MAFDAKGWHILIQLNTAANGPVCPNLVNGDHVWSRIWSMYDLFLMEAEVRNLGLRYHVMACMALWGQREQILPKESYNGPIYILVPRYDKFLRYYWLHYQFWPISTFSRRFDHLASKKPSKCKLARNCMQWQWQYVLLQRGISIYIHVWRIAAHSGQLWIIGSEFLRMFFDAKVWQTLHNAPFNGPVYRHLVNGDHVWSRMWSMNVLVLLEAEVRNLGLRYQVMAGMPRWDKFLQIWPKVA